MSGESKGEAYLVLQETGKSNQSEQERANTEFFFFSMVSFLYNNPWDI